MNAAAFTTGARDGDARASGALARILKSKKLPTSFAGAGQVHGTRVEIVSRLRSPRTFPGIDGLLTEAAQQPLAVFTADCVPVFISADRGRVVGLLHAGWRGVRGGILAEAVRLLRRRLFSDLVQVWTGPSIGPCCFEVRWDVAKHFPMTRRRAGDRWRVDLAGELKLQGRRLGCLWVSQKAYNGCTMHGKRCFSYRRDKTAKRQVSVIMKRNEP